MAEPVKKVASIERLQSLIKTLRGDGGCPWDKKQTPKSMARYLIEEAFELVDAIVTDNIEGVCEEAGDVLFQLLFVIDLYRNAGHFNLKDVIEQNLEKMVNRHPHVFGDVDAKTPEAVSQNWQKIKLIEKGGNPPRSVLDAIPKGMPAMLRAAIVSERAAKTGFDWEDISGVMAKTMEEWEEFSREINHPGNSPKIDQVAVEFGDILFSMVNVARFAKIDPELALMQSIQKFEKRFRFMEDRVKASERSLDALTFAEMHQLWDEAKEKIG